MATKQSTLLFMVFFSLVLSSSSSKILHSELQDNDIGDTIKDGDLPKNHSGQHSVAHISTIHYSHGGRGVGGRVGGGVGGGRGSGSGGDGSQGDATRGTRNPNGAGAANMNHHRRGASSRVQSSVFLTWVVAIFVAQFSTQVL